MTYAEKEGSEMVLFRIQPSRDFPADISQEADCFAAYGPG